MLRKSMGFLLASMLMNSTFALTIHQGVILENKEWTTGNSLIQVKEQPHQSNKNIRESLLQNNLKDQEGILLRNKVDQDVDGVVGKTTAIGGVLETYIENFTPMAQTYKISSNFCITTSEDSKTNPCHYRSYKIELDPYGWFQLDVIRVFTYEFPEPGIFGAGFFMTVEKEGGTTMAVTYDLASINIEAVEE